LAAEASGQLPFLGLVCLGTNDLPRAAADHGALLAEIGAKRLMDFGRGYACGRSMERCSLGIMTPFDGKPATVGNGLMPAIAVNSRERVDRVYAKATALGSQDESPPGPRSEGFYAACFRDPDGNILNVCYVG
jgi:catechol 2,3-dioxygenase-like lactoylglutathione lyase family enzyme